jgi:Leucine-rich repeat (LRR) protein
LTELHWLDLSGNKLEASDLLGRGRSWALRWLGLSGKKSEGKGTEVLVRSPLIASLVELDLSDNALGDEEMVSIAALAWPLLTKLALAANQITDKGALALAAAQSMPRLRVVLCRNNRIDWQTCPKLGSRFRQY